MSPPSPARRRPPRPTTPLLVVHVSEEDLCTLVFEGSVVAAGVGYRNLREAVTHVVDSTDMLTIVDVRWADGTRFLDVAQPRPRNVLPQPRRPQ